MNDPHPMASRINGFIKDLNSLLLVQGTEQLLVRLGIATSASSTGPMLVVTDDLHPNGYMPRYMVVVLARPIFCGVLAILPTLKAGPEKMKSLLPGHRHQTLFSWFRVALPLYDPVHGGTGKPRWEASGLNCSRRSHQGSSGPPSCSIPTRAPSYRVLCPHLRRRPGRSGSC